MRWINDCNYSNIVQYILHLSSQSICTTNTFFQFCSILLDRYSNKNEEWGNSQGNRDSIDVFAYCTCFAYRGLIKNRRIYMPKSGGSFNFDGVSFKARYIGQKKMPYSASSQIDTIMNKTLTHLLWKSVNTVTLSTQRRSIDVSFDISESHSTFVFRRLFLDRISHTLLIWPLLSSVFNPIIYWRAYMSVIAYTRIYVCVHAALSLLDFQLMINFLFIANWAKTYAPALNVEEKIITLANFHAISSFKW